VATIFTLSFTSDKPAVIIHGEKYYKCSSYTKIFVDTIENGYGTLWIERTTKTVTTYDAINCNDLKK
jgi:hypothetical protein